MSSKGESWAMGNTDPWGTPWDRGVVEEMWCGGSVVIDADKLFCL